MRRIKSGFVFALLLIFLAPPLSFAQIKETIARTIVRVKSGNRASTGFFWGNGTTVLTTLHSIGNPNNIEVFIPALNSWRQASVSNAYKDGDVVRLTVANYSSPHFISDRYTTAPPADTRAFAIGYNAGNTSYQDRNFTVGLLQGNTLRDLLPASAEEEIRRLSFPSLSTNIVYLQGALLHGFSGSPVVDYNGKLLGIADGGLENGAASVSWCIHANVIPLLERSLQTISFLTEIAASVNTLFAAEEYSASAAGANVVSLGSYRFRKIKTRYFYELNTTGGYTSSDEMGLAQLLQYMNTAGINYSNFRYDIYLEELTGATLVLPAGMQLTAFNGKLTAASADGKYRFKINIENTSNAYDMQNKSLIFENSVPDFALPPYNAVVLDTRLSYLGPIIRPDGTTINRKAFYNVNYNHYFFEAFAYKGSALLSISVDMANGCYLDPTGMPAFNLPAETALYNLAIQLTTFGY